MNRRTIVIGVAVALLALAGLALAMVPRGAVSGPLPASGEVTNQQLRDVVAKGARLVDVRTAAEFTGGHIEGAENVPIDTVPTASGSWDKTAAVAVYCATGARSLNAFEYLKAQGFTHVYNLTNGIAAWDGKTVAGAASGGSAAFPATGKPTLYDFATSG
jgi:phage shock protein E